MIELAPSAQQMFLYLVLPPLALGFVLFKLGCFPRRRGRTPHCRRCDYTLTGLPGNQCPECGQALSPGATVYGERRRRPALGVAGGLLLLLALANMALILVGDRMKWYQIKPTAWVIDDAADPSSAIAVRAWDELMRRAQAGTLTEVNEHEMTELALREQGNAVPGPIGGQLLQYLGGRAGDGKLTNDQRTRFLDQGMNFTVTARPKIAPGDPLVYRIEYGGRGAGPANWMSKFSPVAIRVDGKPIAMRGSTTTTTTWGGGGSMTSDTDYASPGEHTLAIDVDHEVRNGPESRPPFAKQLLTVTTTFTVLPDRSDELVKLVPNEEHVDALRRAITVNSVSRQAGSSHLNVNLTCRTLPVNVAFDIIGRVGGEEIQIGTLALRKGSNMGYGLNPLLKKPVADGDRITIIFRSSDRVARQTVDIYEAWKGELVYEHVIGTVAK